MSDSSLKYVNCPPAFTDLFRQAEKSLAGFFAGMERNPEKGQIAIHGERYILARAAPLVSN